MEIRLHLYSILREKLPKDSKGRALIHMEDGATLADLLTNLGIENRVVVSVNDVHEPEHSRLLEDGDRVKIFSSISGGQCPTCL